MNRVTIVPATLRDVSYILANLCDADRIELECQVPLQHLSAVCMASEGWVALLDGQPVQAFGSLPATLSVRTLWAFGTARRRRAIPAITRFLREQSSRWVRDGVTRCEARAIVGHPTAHRWLLSLGGEAQPCKAWGRNGEDFVLYSWTRETWAGVSLSG